MRAVPGQRAAHRRVAGRAGAPRAEPFPGVLVLPIGFAGLIVLSPLLTAWKATAPLAGVGAAAMAFGGLVSAVTGWGAGGRRAAARSARCGRGPARGVIAAPVLLTGQPGFTGFGKITDLAHQFSFSEWLRTEGRRQVGAGASSYEEIVDKLVGSNYPGGLQAVVAALGDLARVDIAWAYQPVLAFVAAMLGLALYSLLARAIPSAPACAIAAGIAAQPTILVRLHPGRRGQGDRRGGGDRPGRGGLRPPPAAGLVHARARRRGPRLRPTRSST